MMKHSLMLGAALMLAPALAAGQNMTKHDFSNDGWNNTGEVCAVCHTPHNADATVADAPLWDHAVTAETFTPYSNATLTATVGQPTGVSKLCLSCHDGITALDSFGGATGTNTIGGADNLGTNLSDDHPISFTYDATLATNDGGLFDPTTATSGLGSTITADLLIGGSMECSSCHNVHGDNTFANLLHKSNAGSALCLTCHDK